MKSVAISHGPQLAAMMLTKTAALHRSDFRRRSFGATAIAHMMQATSGLGAPLSLESSVVFSLLLAHYLNKPSQSLTTGKVAVELAAKGLYEIQNPKAANIRAQARRRSMMKTQFRGVWFEYLFIYTFICGPTLPYSVSSHFSSAT